MKRARIAAGKIATRGTDIGHEKGIADKYADAFNGIGHVGRGVPGNVHGCDAQLADPEGLSVIDDAIKLRGVGLEIRAKIENTLEYMLYLHDPRADGGETAQLFF